jgi:ATP-binding cassette subfamily B protein
MKPGTGVDAAVWPLARLGDALAVLAHRSGLQSGADRAPALPDGIAATADPDTLARWVDWASRRLGLEAEPVATSVSGFEDLLRGAGPALVQVPASPGQPAGLLVLLRARGRTLTLVGPDLQLRRLPVAALRDRVCAAIEAPLVAEIDRLLDLVGVAPRRRMGARQAMLRERLATRTVGACWLLRLSATAGFWRQLTQARMPRKVGLMLGAFGLVYGLEMLAWALVGQTSLNGRADLGWLAAWALLVLTLVPLRMLGGWLDAGFALGVGRMLKARLLAGALRMDTEQVRRQGAGQLLSRVMESQALESLALNGGLGVLVSVLELLFAAGVLAAGAGGPWQVALLVAWLLLTLAMGWRYFHRLRDWTRMRLDMTHALVERMVGHRTRLAQEPPLRRQAQDDQAMGNYLVASKAMDHAIVPALAVLPRGWMLVALLGLAPAFVQGGAGPADFAIGLGGMLLANRALTGISGGIAALSRAVLAWRQVSDLFHASGPSTEAVPFLPAATDTHPPASRLVDASGLVFSYHPDSEPVLRGADLAIRHGERLLLEGPSGGGKSTLASLLVGLRTPQAGLLLLNGLDRHSLGPAWHQWATEAPQFHENHILSASLAFNLLMGRHWPASEDDLAHARQLCEDLGLGELLARMPSGLMQMVGETGWQLSHGERSRIFLARALLQEAPLTVLDESFAALDPQTLELCLQCTLQRAKTLVVIAHP